VRFPFLVDPLLVRLGVLLVVIAAAVGFGVRRRMVDGRVRTPRSDQHVTAADLGAELGGRATLLQFSAPVCAPCRAARRVLTAVSESVPDVVHIELDAGDHLELVRRLGVLRTPTVLVLDPAGNVVARASGVPTHPQLAEALALAAA
jgi:thiol-disulfide isomerase/thioredoxin